MPVSRALLERQGVTEAEYRAVHHFLRKNAVKKGCCTNPKCRREGKTYWSLRPGKPYVADRRNFLELCASCAQLIDTGGTLTRCKYGHGRERYTYVDKDGKGHCYVCIVERNRKMPPGSLRRLPRPLKRRRRSARLGRR